MDRTFADGNANVTSETDGHPRSRRAAENHRRICWSGELADIRAEHRKNDEPAGWRELGQTPEFDEYTVVLRRELQVQTRDKNYNVAAEQAIIVHAGEWVRYSTPQGAEYIAVCLPAFSPQTVHRAE